MARLDMFGSGVSGTFNPDTSDVDFIVLFADEAQGVLYRFVNLADALEELLHRPIDLLTGRSIASPDFRARVEAHRETIYDRKNDQAVA